jgi:hypothetical protein
MSSPLPAFDLSRSPGGFNRMLHGWAIFCERAADHNLSATGPLFLFLLPAAVGVFQGVRGTHIRLKAALTLAAAVTALMVFLWSNGRLWVVNWSPIWPVWCIFSTARRAGGEVDRL